MFWIKCKAILVWQLEAFEEAVDIVRPVELLLNSSYSNFELKENSSVIKTRSR